MCSTLPLLLAPQKWQLGLLVSLHLLGQEFAPTVHICSCFSSHTGSLHFVVQGAVCPGASTAALGPGSQFPPRLSKLMVEGR